MIAPKYSINKTVRQVLKILPQEKRVISHKIIDDRIEKIKQECILKAKEIGIKFENLDIKTIYYPDFAPMEYPVGPTKFPESWQECLNMYPSKNCVVSIVITDKSEY